MDVETKELLRQFFPSFSADKEMYGEMHKMLTDPKWLETAETLRKQRIGFMTEQIRDGKWATIYVRRTGDTLVINWEYKKIVGEDPDNIHILGSLVEIDFVPEAKKLASSLIVSAKGNGTVRVKLEEGICYLLQFVFVNEHTEFREDAEVDATNKVDIVLFHVAVPLADDKKVGLPSRGKKLREPHEIVSEKLKGFLSVQEVFSEMHSLAVTQIKARNLSPEEEKRELESFNLKADRLKDEMEM